MLQAETSLLGEFQSGELLGWICVCIGDRIEGKRETAQLHTQPPSG